MDIEARTTVNAQSYRFQLGRLECLSLSDGSVNYPPGHLFANVPKGQIEEALRPYELHAGYVTTPCIHLYIHTGQRRVLVDMGAGQVAPGTGRLRHNLAVAGIQLESVDTVIITHAHPTHVGGAHDDRGRPVYANARYYASRDEWEFWTSEVAFAKAPGRQVAIARASLEPIRDRLTLLQGESEIAPGVRVLPLAGHTPGHMIVSVSSFGERLLYVADLAFHPLHLEHPDWFPIYDVAPEQAEAGKRAILDWAAREGILLMGHHLAPFPGLGHVVKAGEGWQWQPVEEEQNLGLGLA
jgi:glyoxylase-like metal-dependent hydrolase (beta-lactamase superfamily II)